MEIMGTEIKGTSQQWQVTHVNDANCEFMFHRLKVTYFSKFFCKQIYSNGGSCNIYNCK